MDLEAQKKRKQIIFIVVGFVLAAALLFWQFGLPALRSRGTQPATEVKATTSAATTTAPAATAPGAAPAAGIGPGPGAPGAAAAPGAPSGSLGQLAGSAEPVLPSHRYGDPFGIPRAFAALLPATSRGETPLAAAALFGSGTWGVAERDGTTRGGRGATAGPPLSPVKIPAINVTPPSNPPVPAITPPGDFQRVTQPTSIEGLLPVGQELPSVPSPEMEGMRLAGIVRTGQPRGILEWRTPEGALRSQVVAPNEPLVWPPGGNVERLSSDYAIVKDAQGTTWRVPLRY